MIWLDSIILLAMGMVALGVFSIEILNALTRYRERVPRRTELITSIKPMAAAAPLHLNRYRRRLFPFFQ
jgi:hypothetical protein